MRPTQTVFLTLNALALTTAFLIPSTFHDLKALSGYLPSSKQQPGLVHQSPDMNTGPGPVQPNQPSPPSDTDTDSPDLTISDILPLSRQINIFAQLTRDIASITTRLSTPASVGNTTLLAPLNSAMQDLPRKPWEDRPGDDDSSDVSAEYNEEKAAENLRRFVESHVVPVAPWAEGEKVETLGGGEVWWEEEDGKRIVKGKGWDVEVAQVLGVVGNGEVWAVKGVVNYE
jgi:hypothetical protein